MRKVLRSEILDYQTYGDQREQTRGAVLEAKAKRRVHLGEHLTFLFENADTIRYQIQEMMRLERMVREKDVQHELDTYNQLLGDDGELGCSLLVEIDDAEKRDVYLVRWRDLVEHLYVRVEDGSAVSATWDPAQVGEDRLSSVQYLKFPVGDRVPVGIGCSHPELTLEAEFTEEQRTALLEDLASR